MYVLSTFCILLEYTKKKKTNLHTRWISIYLYMYIQVSFLFVILRSTSVIRPNTDYYYYWSRIRELAFPLVSPHHITRRYKNRANWTIYYFIMIITRNKGTELCPTGWFMCTRRYYQMNQRNRVEINNAINDRTMISVDPEPLLFICFLMYTTVHSDCAGSSISSTLLHGGVYLWLKRGYVVRTTGKR